MTRADGRMHAPAAVFTIAAALALSLALPSAAQDAPAADPADEAQQVEDVTAQANDAPAPDADALLAGKRLYADAACANCHGNRGQGGGGVDFPDGPSLRTSGLDKETMELVISCGIPGTRMPAWLKGAYTETECYGEPIGPHPAGTIVTGIFSEEEISTLVDYIIAEFQQPAQAQ